MIDHEEMFTNAFVTHDGQKRSSVVAPAVMMADQVLWCNGTMV